MSAKSIMSKVILTKRSQLNLSNNSLAYNPTSFINRIKRNYCTQRGHLMSISLSIPSFNYISLRMALSPRKSKTKTFNREIESRQMSTTIFSTTITILSLLELKITYQSLLHYWFTRILFPLCNEKWYIVKAKFQNSHQEWIYLPYKFLQY